MTLRFAIVLAISGLSGSCVTADGSASGYPAAITGLGTEPFWSLNLIGEDVILLTPEDRAGKSGRVRRRLVDGALIFAGKLGGMSVRGRISREPCSDGMSDRTYPFTLAWTLGETAMAGCAFPQDMKLAPA